MCEIEKSLPGASLPCQLKAEQLKLASIRASRKVAAPWLAPASVSLVLQLLKIELRRTARKVKHLNTDQLVVLVEVQHHAGGDFVR